MKSVEFKSDPEFFNKEKDGRKKNTVRFVDNGDEKFQRLKDSKVDLIKITCSKTNDFFIRKITDVSHFKDYVIISWGNVSSID